MHIVLWLQKEFSRSSLPVHHKFFFGVWEQVNSIDKNAEQLIFLLHDRCLDYSLCSIHHLLPPKDIFGDHSSGDHKNSPSPVIQYWQHMHSNESHCPIRYMYED